MTFGELRKKYKYISGLWILLYETDGIKSYPINFAHHSKIDKCDDCELVVKCVEVSCDILAVGIQRA